MTVLELLWESYTTPESIWGVKIRDHSIAGTHPCGDPTDRRATNSARDGAGCRRNPCGGHTGVASSPLSGLMKTGRCMNLVTGSTPGICTA